MYRRLGAIVLIATFPLPGLAAEKGQALPDRKAAGRWYYWTDNGYVRVRAFSRNSLWLGGYRSSLWRYDLRTKKLREFTPLDGLALEDSSIRRVTTGLDDRCAILMDWRREVYLWDPKAGWRMAPDLPEGRRPVDIAYDGGGRLLCICGNRGDGRDIPRWAPHLFELADGKWKPLRKIPEASVLIPIKGGYMLTVYDRKKRKPFGYYLSLKDPKVLKVFPLRPGYTYFRYYRMGGKVYALPYQIQISKRLKGYAPVCEVTADGFVEHPKGRAVGLDLLQKRFVPLNVQKTTDDRSVCRIEQMQGFQFELPRDPNYSTVFPVRDPVGNVWSAGRYWDGSRWRQIGRGGGLPSNLTAVDRARAKFDPATGTWKMLTRGPPHGDVTGYDPITRRGWVVDLERSELQYVQFAEKKKKVLRRMPYKRGMGMPMHQSSGGDWWWVSRMGVMRLTASGLRRYSVGSNYGIWLSPKKTIWVNPRPGYHRYDAEEDEFVKGEPWDDFAFKVGEFHLSMLPGRGTSALRRKVRGRWELFMTHFHKKDHAQGTPYMVRGDRMLITVPAVGVLEYDAKKDRWIRLHRRYFHAGFDSSGRRVLASHGCVLVYVGDPFEHKDEAATKGAERDDALFNTLLKLMDDDQWRVREEASAKMKKVARTMQQRLQAALHNKELSSEVRVRIKAILEEGGPGRLLPPDLFRRMYPLLGKANDSQ